jgi:hypothetical protein
MVLVKAVHLNDPKILHTVKIVLSIAKHFKTL